MIRDDLEVLPLYKDMYIDCEQRFSARARVLKQSSDRAEQANAAMYYVIADGFSRLTLDDEFMPDHFGP